MWAGGFCTLLVVPSPKFQDQPVTLPVEVSLKVASSGAGPLVGLAVKPATGAVAVVEMVLVVVVLPPALLTVNFTV